MRRLPNNQISKGQWLSSELPIEPDAKGVQAHFRRQVSLEASQIVPNWKASSGLIFQNILLRRFVKPPSML